MASQRKRPAKNDNAVVNEVSPQKKIKNEDTTKQKADFLEVIRSKRQLTATSVEDFKFNKKRVRVLSTTREPPDSTSAVLYWMSRDQRVQDNWAFLYAQRLALKLEVPLHVCFCLVPTFLEATIRHYHFLLEGLKEVEKECHNLDIAFHLLIGSPVEQVPKFVTDYQVGAVLADFSPLRVPAAWVDGVKAELPKAVPLCQVDSHNVVPCWEASPKLEYGARTIRTKIHRQLDLYFTEFPPLVRHRYKHTSMPQITNWSAAEASLRINTEVRPVEWAQPGATAGLQNLESFIKHRLKSFGTDRNNPNNNALSNMSPWFHFGQVSVQRAMLMVNQYKTKYKQSVAAYIEEGIIRRELADNFCYYNPHYDNVKGAYDWAKKTLEIHAKDKRKFLYSREQLEGGKTHDQLWNAAQLQMVREGKMHGFLRMYWAKKILEWTASPETALADAIYLNDKYSLDGRDPNGYVGCMWSICGIHDQGWKEREIFGKIRYMNYEGCKKKFNVAAFELKYKPKAPL